MELSTLWLSPSNQSPTMERHFKALIAERVLLQVELLIAYKEAPVPVQGQM